MTKKKEHKEELTLALIKNVTRSSNFETVTYLNIYGCGVSNIEKLSMLKSLSICLLANNYISDIAPILDCTRLLKLDVSRNQISALPCYDKWAQLHSLRILYLHDNTISKVAQLQDLSGAPNLNVLTLFDTPVSIAKHYRHHVVNTIWSLKCLDQLIVSDEEVIEDANFGDRFAAYHPELRIGSLPAISKELDEAEALRQCLRTLKLVNGILRHCSPVMIIQNAWRDSRAKQHANELGQLRHWAAICIQRYWRMKHHLPQKAASPTKVFDVKRPEQSEIFSPLTLQTTLSDCDILKDKEIHPRSAGDADGKDKIAFRISSGKLRENITQKTSLTKVWGAVPFRAGLEGNVFERRGLEVAESDEEKPELQIRSPSEEEPLALVAEPARIVDQDHFREMVMSRREGGRVVREAANHYRQIQAYRPRTVKSSKNRGPVSNQQRLFAKVQDNMALSCLMAVQQAYKNRSKIESHAAKMDKVLLQRHQHKVVLARVDAIRNAARIETLHNRELDDAKHREKMYLQQQKEQGELISLINKRDKVKYSNKDKKQYKQFITDFCCQNASLSKALARHDRRTIRDDIAANANEKVQLLREQNVRSQRTVSEFKEFVKLRRQAEAEYDRTQVNTVLSEETKQRKEEVVERVEYLRSLRNKPSTPLHDEEEDQLEVREASEIIAQYKQDLTEAQPESVLLGRAIQPGSSRSLSKTAPSGSGYPKHLGTIKFDLTLPQVTETSKTSLQSTGGHSEPKPIRLNPLFLNSSHMFPRAEYVEAKRCELWSLSHRTIHSNSPLEQNPPHIPPGVTTTSLSSSLFPRAAPIEAKTRDIML